MNTNISGVFFTRRRSTGSAAVSQVFKIEDGGDTKTEPTVTTMADCVRPLLTSMKLFGLYFKRGTDTRCKVTDEGSRRRWNGYMIYGLVVVIVMWINVARMFSVFNCCFLLCAFIDDKRAVNVILTCAIYVCMWFSCRVSFVV